MAIAHGSAVLAALTVAALGIGLAAPAIAQVKPVCTNASRACLLKTTMVYLDGLARHDASAIPFSPDVRATEQGSVVVTDEKTFRAEIDGSKAITGARNVRLFADAQSQSVGAFYILDIAGENGKPPYSVWRGQRFRIVGGRVTEVEVYNYFAPDPQGLGEPIWPGGTTLPIRR